MTPKDIANAVFPFLKSRVPSASLGDGWVNIKEGKYYNVYFHVLDKGVTIHLGEAKAKYVPKKKNGEFNYEKMADRIIAMQEEDDTIQKNYNKWWSNKKRDEDVANELSERFKDVARISPSIRYDGTYTVHLKDLGRIETKEKIVEFLEKYRARMKD